MPQRDADKREAATWLDAISATASPPNTPKLPEIAADATDLKALRTVVVDAASVGAGLWISYLFVLFYLLIAAGSVTHKDLFFETPVKLPFLGVDLPSKVSSGSARRCS